MHGFPSKLSVRTRRVRKHGRVRRSYGRHVSSEPVVRYYHAVVVVVVVIVIFVSTTR